MAVVRWVFDDPNTLASYTFAVNPREGGSPSYQKTLTSLSTAAPDGKVLRFEGRDAAQTLEFTGVLFTEAEFNAFVEWWEKRYQILVTDDLGRQFTIEIESFIPTRERAIQHPWKHSYRITATIVNCA